MTDFERKRHDQWEKLRALRKSFDAILNKLSEKDIKEPIDAVRTIFQEISGIRAELSRDYSDSLQHHKLPSLDDRLSAENHDDLINLLIQIDRHLKTLEAEIKHVYPARPWFQNFANYKKQAATTFAIIAGVVLMGTLLVNLKSSKQGLTATYYSDRKLSRYYKMGVSSTINFDWKKGSPLRRWRKNLFSIRWTGYLMIPKDGKYEFQTISDDGVRLWIGDALVIDDWTTGKARKNSTEMALLAGYHPVKLEYFEQGNLASVKLKWKSGKKWETIPPRSLIPLKKHLKPNFPVHESP